MDVNHPTEYMQAEWKLSLHAYRISTASMCSANNALNRKIMGVSNSAATSRTFHFQRQLVSTRRPILADLVNVNILISILLW